MVIGSLTVLFYAADDIEAAADAIVDGQRVFFFNVTPGTVEVRITRDGEAVYTQSYGISAGVTMEVHARVAATTDGGGSEKRTGNDTTDPGDLNTPQPVEVTGTIQGRVVDGVDGSGVANASVAINLGGDLITVLLDGTANIMVATNVGFTGEFRLTNITTGEVISVTVAPGS